MAEAESGAAGGYVAFISYSHRDAAIGRWLHRRLEGYRVPKRLAGTQGEDGEVPARLTPIFRDRDELPAAGNLSEKVRTALAASRNLIVLCSPNSAASPWVAKEIATFRELHPDRPIFTAIVEGEPDQCFPPALREGGIEPLAADLRKQGDGRRLGLLKLVAGLAGVGLDTLVQRDAARRIRRVSYVTAAAVAALLIMGLSTVMALNARAEAERQRAEAESLVEFMLTDLRERLRGVGRIDVMQEVNKRSLAYYRGLDDLEGLPDASLARRARIFQAMGDDHLDREDAAAALAAFRAAERTTAQLAARAPDDPRRLFEHAKTLGGIGRAYEIREDWPAADRYFTAFAAAAEQLLKVAPGDPDYLMKAASAAIDLGNVRLRGSRNYPAAQQAYEKAIGLLDRAAARRPDDVHILLSRANAHGWLADTFFYREDWPRSLRARSEQHAIVERLNRRDRDNVDIRFRLVAAQRGLACSLLHLGRGAEGRARLESAHLAAADLVRRDPANGTWRALREKLATDVAELNRRTGATAVPEPKGQPRCVPRS
ncbi:MAG TPA: toll/interleukin-1 receptor domain-containing protein [Allosphingosinicella sp.]|nr:toll/interleukin-1 receptor domain-containing protein [Allosphingosinicella sp.]